LGICRHIQSQYKRCPRGTHTLIRRANHTRILRIDIHRSVRKIARHLHLGPGTISDCLVTPAPSGRQPAKKTDPFKTTIAELWHPAEFEGRLRGRQRIPGDSSALSPRSRLASGAWPDWSRPLDYGLVPFETRWRKARAPRVFGQLGVEGCGHHASLPDGDGFISLVAMTSTPRPTRSILGARMKTISSAEPAGR